jgi:hypothetical protein
MIYLIVGAGILVAVTGYFVVRGRRGKREEVYHFRCPGCDLKVRYGPGAEGQRIRCPRCLRSCKLDRSTQDSARATTTYRFRSYIRRR